MPYKRLEPDMKEIAKRWLSGWIWRDTPKITVECHLCHGIIRGGTKVYRCITGFHNNRPQVAFVCEECGRQLVEFMIKRLQKLLGKGEEETE